MAILGRRAAVLMLANLVTALVSLAQSTGPAIVSEYWRWRETAKPLPADQDPIALFRAKLHADGLSEATAAERIEALRKGLIAEEGEFYDTIYAKKPRFNTKPNKLLIEAAQGRVPGDALDVGTGQGRNAVFLAQRGWNVTGLDPSVVGLQQARRNAAKANVRIQTVQAGAEYFDFGRDRWDLIAIIYPIEKYSVYRVREALKPGGLIVVEAPHKEAAPYPNHYDSNELLEIFRGFRIYKYEDTNAVADWDRKTIRLVRLIAEKPR